MAGSHFHSSFSSIIDQWSITGSIKAMVCAILSMGYAQIKDPLLPFVAHCGDSGFPLKNVCQNDHYV